MLLITLGTLNLFGAAVASIAPAMPDQIPVLPDPGTIVQEPNRPISVMVVGDSITQGSNGDWTWRYRIWEWFRDQDVKVDFVGPWKGTNPPDISDPPESSWRNPLLYCSPPKSDGPPTQQTTGGYAVGVDPNFDSDHFSAWGRQLKQDADLIRDMVATYNPDYLLVLLGFNDMGWFVSDAEGTFESMKLFISEARAAKPDINMALGNVPQRRYMNCRDDLPIKTNLYNKMLAAAIPQWSTPTSQIELVRMQENYGCDLDACPGGYDGLHPNALGEYQIAQAFSRTLLNDFSIGDSELAIPAEIPARPLPVPANFKAISTAEGVTVFWDPVYGANGYELDSLLVGTGSWSKQYVNTNRWDTRSQDGWEYKFRIRSKYGDTETDWSDIISIKYRTPK